jgi:hypothetical protein
MDTQAGSKPVVGVDQQIRDTAEESAGTFLDYRGADPPSNRVTK